MAIDQLESAAATERYLELTQMKNTVNSKTQILSTANGSAVLRRLHESKVEKLSMRKGYVARRTDVTTYLDNYKALRRHGLASNIALTTTTAYRNADVPNSSTCRHQVTSGTGQDAPADTVAAAAESSGRTQWINSQSTLSKWRATQISPVHDSMDSAAVRRSKQRILRRANQK